MRNAWEVVLTQPSSADEELIRYAWPEDVWFHVDKLSSPHIYLRLPEGVAWDSIAGSEAATDAAQLVKAGSIEGNKRDNLTVIYCPARVGGRLYVQRGALTSARVRRSNLKKDGSMDVGTVSFKSDKLVRRIHVARRDNAVVNRLKKTLEIRSVDHEAERIERQRARDRASRAAAHERKEAELELARQRAADKESRSYATLRSEEAIAEAMAAARRPQPRADDAAEGSDDDDFW